MSYAFNMSDRTNLAFFDEGLYETDRWVHGSHWGVSAFYACLCHPIKHGTGIFCIHGEGLVADDMASMCSSELRDFAVRRDGRRDGDNVGPQVLDGLLPVETQIINSELGTLFLCWFRRSTAQSDDVSTSNTSARGRDLHPQTLYQ